MTLGTALANYRFDPTVCAGARLACTRRALPLPAGQSARYPDSALRPACKDPDWTAELEQ